MSDAGSVHMGPAWFARPTTAEIEDLLGAARRGTPTFAGTDASAAAPAGFRHERWTRRIGVLAGENFSGVGEAILTYDMQRGAGFAIHPTDARAEVDATVLVVAGLGPRGKFPWTVAPCRVIDVRRDENEIGFTYATLPGHAEDGVERFAVRRAPTGAAELIVEAISRPSLAILRLGAPVARRVQTSIAMRYLDSVTLR